MAKMFASGEGVVPGIVGQDSSDEQLSLSSLNSNYTTGSDDLMDFNGDHGSPKRGDGDSSEEEQREVMIRHLSKELLLRDKKIEELEAIMRSNRQGFGRNNLNKSQWDGTDLLNEKAITSYIRQSLFKNYKFLPTGWDVYTPDVEMTVCHELITSDQIKLPQEHGAWYWKKRVEPIMNKKYVELRSNANSNHRTQYISKENCLEICHCVYMPLAYMKLTIILFLPF